MQLDDKYIYGHCVSPIKVQIRNPLNMLYEEREVPCGRCLHCKMTKKNEWLTRMYLQSLYSKYTYFVTLTYDVEMMTNEQLMDTHAIVHNCNYKHDNMLRPLTLCKRHHQLFFKRLRKYYKQRNIDFSCQYFIVGEYGDTYGAPHYHMALWSNIELFNPLTDVINEDHHLSHTTSLYKSWNMGIVSAELLNGEILDNLGNINKSFGYISKYIQKDKQEYKNLPTFKYHIANLQKIKSYENNSQNSIITDEDYSEYWRTYGHYMSCSRKPAIGGGYFDEYQEKFRSGEIRLHGVQEQSLLLPSYFVKKSKRLACPYLRYSEKGNNQISNVYTEDLTLFIADLLDTMQSRKNALLDEQKIIPMGDKSPCYLRQYRKQMYNFQDVISSIYYIYDPKLQIYNKYKYSRKERLYKYVGSDSLLYVYNLLTKSFAYYKQKFLVPFRYAYERNKREFDRYIKEEFNNDVNAYKIKRYKIYESMCSVHKTRQAKYLLTKNKF